MANIILRRIDENKERTGAGILIIWYFLSMLGLPLLFPDIFLTDFFDYFTYITVFILSIVVFKNRLIRDFQAIKNHKKQYMRWYIPRFVIVRILYYVVAVAALYIGGKYASENQESVESLNTIEMFLITSLYAPFVEECVFRGAFRKYIKKDWLFILVSGLVFGALHVVGEKTLSDFLSLGALYAFEGIALAWFYVKSNNFYTNYFYHFFFNTIAVIRIISGK